MVKVPFETFSVFQISPFEMSVSFGLVKKVLLYVTGLLKPVITTKTLFVAVMSHECDNMTTSEVCVRVWMIPGIQIDAPSNIDIHPRTVYNFA